MKKNEDTILLTICNDEAQSITIKELEDDVAGTIEISDYDDTRAKFEFNIPQAIKIHNALNNFLKAHVRDFDEDDFDEDDFDDEDVEPVFTEEELNKVKDNSIDFLELYFKKKGIPLRDKESKMIFENRKFIEIDNADNKE
jgi:hypothetical protein